MHSEEHWLLYYISYPGIKADNVLWDRGSSVLVDGAQLYLYSLLLYPNHCTKCPLGNTALIKLYGDTSETDIIFIPQTNNTTLLKVLISIIHVSFWFECR